MAIHELTGSGQATSRPLAHTILENCRVMATDALKIANARDQPQGRRRDLTERFKSATIGDRLPRLGEMDAALRTAVDAAEASREPVVEASRPCRLAVNQ